LYNLLTLGILNQKARDQEIFSLAYQPNVEVVGQEAVSCLIQVTLMASWHKMYLEQEGSWKEGKEVHNSTDYHHTC
jgi:hypothetical protein